MLLDKVMLIGALKNDLSIFQNRINEITEIGKLMGKHELTSQFISSLEEGRFDFVSKEDGQEVAEKEMDQQINSLAKKIYPNIRTDNVINETIDLLKD